MFAVGAIGAVVAAVLLSTSFEARAYTIEWRLENPYRTIDGQAAEQKFRTDLERYLRCASVVRRRLAECRLLTPRSAKAYPSFTICEKEWGCHYETSWDGARFRYRDLHNLDRGILVSLRPAIYGQTCIWTLKRADGGAPRELEGPCNGTRMTARVGKNEISVRLRSESPRLAAQLPKSPEDVVINDLFVLVLGDSFMSGEGNPHIVQAMPVSEGDAGARPPHWWDYRCHRSLLASPSLAAAEFTRIHPKISVTLVSFACSGAEATEGIMSSYIGRETPQQALKLLQLFDPIRTELPEDSVTGILRAETLPSQYESALDSLCLDTDRTQKRISDPCDQQRLPDVVVLGIGVNDLGFSQILADLAKKAGPDNLNQIKQALEDRLKKLKTERLNQLLAPKLNALVSGQGNTGRRSVLFVEYPDPTKDENGAYCDDLRRDRVYASKFSEMKSKHGDALRSPGGRPFLPEPASLVGYGLDRTETEFAFKEVVVRINETIKEVSAEHGWRHIDGIADATRKKGYCSNRSWFHSYWDSFSKQHMVQPFKHPQYGPIGGVPSGAMHPNIFAHKHIAHLLVDEFKIIAKERGFMK